MEKTIFELHPQPTKERSLGGLYLQQNLRTTASRDATFVYANFVMSLDGRIAVPDTDGQMVVPHTTSNKRDWRLFQELAVQSDIMLSSGRYLRDYEAGRAQEILRVYDDPDLADLADWRVEHGLEPHPAIAIISASLDFPIPPALLQGNRKVVTLTTRNAPQDRKIALQNAGLTVIEAGDDEVTGEAAIQGLAAQGYRFIYSAAGPRVLHLLLASNVLDRLYLTFVVRLLGGTPFASILEGSLLPTPTDFTMEKLYFDPHAPGIGGQLFATFDRA